MIAEIEGTCCGQLLGMSALPSIVLGLIFVTENDSTQLLEQFFALGWTPSSEDGQRERCQALHRGHGAFFPWCWPFCCSVHGNFSSCWQGGGLTVWWACFGIWFHLKWAKHKRRMWPSGTAVSVWLCAHAAPLFPVGLFQCSTALKLFPLPYLLYGIVQCSNCNSFCTGIRASSNNVWCWLELASLNLHAGIYSHPQRCSEIAKTEHPDPWNSSSLEIRSAFDHQISFSCIYPHHGY